MKWFKSFFLMIFLRNWNRNLFHSKTMSEELQWRITWRRLKTTCIILRTNCKRRVVKQMELGSKKLYFSLNVKSALTIRNHGAFSGWRSIFLSIALFSPKVLKFLLVKQIKAASLWCWNKQPSTHFPILACLSPLPCLLHFFPFQIRLPV